jgi:hypothetical protein
MTNEDLSILRNRPKNSTKVYSESLLITQESSQGFNAVLTSGKVLDSDNYLNLIGMLLRFINLADKLKFFKRLIRNLYFKNITYFYLSIIKLYQLSYLEFTNITRIIN